MGVTQRQLAEKFGVTRSLVSKALSGHPRVAESTRRRIVEAAVELGYDSASNPEARRLIARRYGKRARTGTLALVVPGEGPDMEDVRTMPFYTPFYAGAEDEAMASGLDIIACRPYRGALPRVVTTGGVDGVIALTGDVTMQDVNALGVPAVSVEVQSPGVTSVIPDERVGMNLLVQHLADLGHRDIAYVSLCTDTPAAVSRLAGYRQGLEAASLAYRNELVDSSLSSMNEAADAAMTLYDRSGDRPYTALICYNDWMAMVAVRALQARGLAVPGDIGVAGFDDISSGYRFEPALTSIAYDRYAMARRAVRIVIGAIEQELPCEYKTEIFPVELAVRQSTDRVR